MYPNSLNPNTYQNHTPAPTTFITPLTPNAVDVPAEFILEPIEYKSGKFTKW
ncbi:hypothetical protein [Hyunsoonleella pacifica]|uniref:hypothetical protein n=1 Tax=Hyunsoonleella pacifica TaxID=1080224 RepID=UPI0013EF4049|nr:hypothetical protein [Hyunsoonleella pacifica]GGD08086.1 hypothetical protein GCM10011368_07580 [Hyunsoonleella pacifica]